MVIYSNLSGRAIVKVRLPDSVVSQFDSVQAEFSRQKIEERFASLSGVSLKNYSLSEGRHPEATFEIAFTSLEKLSAAAAANPPAQMLVGEFVVKKDEEGRTVVERNLGKGTATMELPSDKFAQFKIHFQSPVELSNTDSGFKDGSHNDVRYRWSLSDIDRKRPSMINKLVKPFPWVYIVGGAVALLILGRILWPVFMKKKVKMPAASAPAKPPAGPASAQAPVENKTPQRPGPPRRPGPQR